MTAPMNSCRRRQITEASKTWEKAAGFLHPWTQIAAASLDHPALPSIWRSLPVGYRASWQSLELSELGGLFDYAVSARCPRLRNQQMKLFFIACVACLAVWFW